MPSHVPRDWKLSTVIPSNLLIKLNVSRFTSLIINYTTIKRITISSSIIKTVVMCGTCTNNHDS